MDRARCTLPFGGSGRIRKPQPKSEAIGNFKRKPLAENNILRHNYENSPFNRIDPKEELVELPEQEKKSRNYESMDPESDAHMNINRVNNQAKSFYEHFSGYSGYGNNSDREETTDFRSTGQKLSRAKEWNNKKQPVMARNSPFMPNTKTRAFATEYRSIRDTVESDDSADDGFDPTTLVDKENSRIPNSEVGNFASSPMETQFQRPSPQLIKSSPEIARSMEEEDNKSTHDTPDYTQTTFYQDDIGYDESNEVIRDEPRSTVRVPRTRLDTYTFHNLPYSDSKYVRPKETFYNTPWLEDSVYKKPEREPVKENRLVLHNPRAIENERYSKLLAKRSAIEIQDMEAADGIGLSQMSYIDLDSSPEQMAFNNDQYGNYNIESSPEEIVMKKDRHGNYKIDSSSEKIALKKFKYGEDFKANSNRKEIVTHKDEFGEFKKVSSPEEIVKNIGENGDYKFGTRRVHMKDYGDKSYGRYANYYYRGGRHNDAKGTSGFRSTSEKIARGQKWNNSKQADPKGPVSSSNYPSNRTIGSIHDSGDLDDSAYEGFNPALFSGNKATMMGRDEMTNFTLTPEQAQEKFVAANTSIPEEEYDPTVVKSVEERVQNMMLSSLPESDMQKTIDEAGAPMRVEQMGRKNNSWADYRFPKGGRGKYLPLPSPPQARKISKPAMEYVFALNREDQLPEPRNFSSETIEITKRIIMLSKPQRLSGPVTNSHAVEVARLLWRLGRCMCRVVRGREVPDPLDPTRPIEGEKQKAIELIKYAGLSEYTESVTSWKLALKLMGTMFRDNFKDY